MAYPKEVLLRAFEALNVVGLVYQKQLRLELPHDPNLSPDNVAGHNVANAQDR